LVGYWFLAGRLEVAWFFISQMPCRTRQKDIDADLQGILPFFGGDRGKLPRIHLQTANHQNCIVQFA